MCVATAQSSHKTTKLVNVAVESRSSYFHFPWQIRTRRRAPQATQRCLAAKRNSRRVASTAFRASKRGTRCSHGAVQESDKAGVSIGPLRSLEVEAPRSRTADSKRCDSYSNLAAIHWRTSQRLQIRAYNAKDFSQRVLLTFRRASFDYAPRLPVPKAASGG